MTKPALDGISMLKDLAAGTMAKHVEKSKGLTPLPGEVGPRPQKIEASFPNDMPTEVMKEALVDLERTRDHITDAIVALKVALGMPRDPGQRLEYQNDIAAPQSVAPDDVEGGKAADAAFAEAFEAKAKAAQAAVFTKEIPITAGGPVHPDETEPGDQWHCPTHGERVEKLSVRRQLPYGTCSQCDQFEKLP